MRGIRLLLVPVVLIAAACGSGMDTDSSSTAPTRLWVFAASSLRDAFTAIGDAFTAANPNVTITFNFAASSALVTQIANGAPADVIATADSTTMSTLTDSASTRTDPVIFATNRAMIIVGAGNPKNITDVSNLSDPDLVVITCAPEVPCGGYARTVLDKAGVSVIFKSFEENVKAVVSKVTLGEADAGIVYATDVLGAGTKAEGVEIPAEFNITAEYPVAITANAVDPATARAFIDFLTSNEARAILESFGFVLP